jgi:CIC family chloride channel protein
MILTADAHNPDLDEKLAEMTAAGLRRGENRFLLAHQNVRTALDEFTQAELEVLPVLASTTDQRVIGFVTEAYALRRYSQELERARAGDLRDDTTLFGPA